MIPKHNIITSLKNNGVIIIDTDKYIKAHLNYQNHRHSFYEVLLILKGSGIHRIDFIDYIIQRNSLSFLSPGQVHNLQKSIIKNCMVLIFNEEFLYKNDENLSLLKQLNLIYNQYPILEFNIDQIKELKPILLIIETELKKEHCNRDILFYSLNVLLHQVLNWCKAKHNIQPFSALANKRHFDFLALVESNYHKEHSVQYYAKQLNIEPKRLNEITKMASGENALHLIQKRLLVEAKRLLFYSQLSIKEISFQLGFVDVSYFSRFFTKNIGMRPSAFKESNPESTT